MLTSLWLSLQSWRSRSLQQHDQRLWFHRIFQELCGGDQLILTKEKNINSSNKLLVHIKILTLTWESSHQRTNLKMFVKCLNFIVSICWSVAGEPYGCFGQRSTTGQDERGSKILFRYIAAITRAQICRYVSFLHLISDDFNSAPGSSLIAWTVKLLGLEEIWNVHFLQYQS